MKQEWFENQEVSRSHLLAFPPKNRTLDGPGQREERPYPDPKTPFTSTPPENQRKNPLHCRKSPSSISDLTAALTRSLRRPTGRTLSLINKALSYLTPFENPRAATASSDERHDLLNLLTAHRLILAPYADLDRIESHLRH